MEQSPDVFLALGKRGLRYIRTSLNPLPSATFPDYRYALNLKECLWFMWQKSLGLLYRIKNRALVVWKYKKDYWLMPAPELWVRCGSYYPAFTVSVPHLHKAKVMDVESTEMIWDRDVSVGADAIPTGPYATFIDESAHDHPDYDVVGKHAPVDAETYFKGLRNFFDKVSEDLNLPVVIAAHPKSNYTDQQKKDWFGDRKVISGITPTLIRKCNLVLAHASTAISYAVLNKKPVFILTSNDFEKSYVKDNLLHLSFRLGQKRINVDDFCGSDDPVLNMPFVDLKGYEKYVHLFLRSPRVRKECIWKTIAIQFEALLEKNDKNI
ncbi:MAG: hypothetical protein JKX85_04790 [Phycisphaeraceae bacterium]|nr:hypothetical protein [Phycisphaeraceae bacterium]